jgi:hypothetical protein
MVSTSESIAEVESSEGELYSKDEFLALSTEEQFNSAFYGINEDNSKEILGKKDIDVKTIPYALKLKNNSGYYESCYYCGDKRCDGCPLEFSDKMMFKDL